MRILLLGADGQVGWELQRSLAPLGELCCTDMAAPYLSLDLRNLDSIRESIREYRPAWVVNAAAYTAVDDAEEQIDLARALNVEAPRVLAEVVDEIGARLIHYSTDYVFDGSGSCFRDESAPTAPISVYGRTKLEGERAIANALREYLILRTSWVYAARGHNFIRTILQLAKERDELSVINDQIGAPTGAELLADVTAHCITHIESGNGYYGTYHCVAAGSTSWFGLAKYVLDRARQSGARLTLAEDGLKETSTANYPTAARRPLNSRLSSEQLQNTFGLQMPEWQLGVDRVLTELGV